MQQAYQGTCKSAVINEATTGPFQVRASRSVLRSYGATDPARCRANAQPLLSCASLTCRMSLSALFGTTESRHIPLSLSIPPSKLLHDSFACLRPHSCTGAGCRYSTEGHRGFVSLSSTSILHRASCSLISTHAHSDAPACNRCSRWHLSSALLLNTEHSGRKQCSPSRHPFFSFNT